MVVFLAWLFSSATAIAAIVLGVFGLCWAKELHADEGH